MYMALLVAIFFLVQVLEVTVTGTGTYETYETRTATATATNFKTQRPKPHPSRIMSAKRKRFSCRKKITKYNKEFVVHKKDLIDVEGLGDLKSKKNAKVTGRGVFRLPCN